MFFVCSTLCVLVSSTPQELNGKLFRKFKQKCRIWISGLICIGKCIPIPIENQEIVFFDVFCMFDPLCTRELNRSGVERKII